MLIQVGRPSLYPEISKPFSLDDVAPPNKNFWFFGFPPFTLDSD